MRVTLLVVAAALLAACNGVSGPVEDRLSQDPRNAVVELNASYGGIFDRSVLVLKVDEPPVGAAPADLFRVLLQSADALKDRDFTTVELHSPSAGHVYSLDGIYFKQLGREYGIQNPVYSMRTFSYELRRPEGGSAFLDIGGGFLGLGNQFEDFGEAMRTWAL